MKDKKIFIFGASGTVGSALTTLLDNMGVPFCAPSHSNCDLLNERSLGDLREKYWHIDPKDMVWINLCGKRTNISTNLKNPVEIYSETLQMSFNYFKAAQRYEIGKVLSFISSCAYPYQLDTLREENIDDGPTHPSISSHGSAKREVVRLSNFYRTEYGLKSSCLVFNNLFGPWKKENESTLKVADALVKRVVDAKRNNLPSVEVWGDGLPLREFLYSKDAAKAIIRYLELDLDLPIINIGNGQDNSIGLLVCVIKDIVGYEGKINFLTEKPNGQMKKLLDNSLMERVMNWYPPTLLSNGLEDTIKWYKDSLEVL